MEKKAAFRIPVGIAKNTEKSTPPTVGTTRSTPFIRIPLGINNNGKRGSGTSDGDTPQRSSSARPGGSGSGVNNASFHVYELVSDLDALQADNTTEQQVWRQAEEALRKLRAGADIVARLKERALDEQAKLLLEPFNVVQTNISQIVNLFEDIQEMHRIRVGNAERIVQRAMAVLMGATPASDGAGDEYELEFGNDALQPYDTTERLNLSTFDT